MVTFLAPPVEHPAFAWAAVLGRRMSGGAVPPYSVVGAATIVAGRIVAARGAPAAPAPRSEAAA